MLLFVEVLGVVIATGVLYNNNVWARQHHSRHSKHSQRRKQQQQQQQQQQQPQPTLGVTTTSPDFSSASPTTFSTTPALTLQVGNQTVNTNLQLALDDISPGVGKDKVIPDSATYPPLVVNNLYQMHNTQPPETPTLKANSSSSSSSVIFEVLGIDPYTKEHRKFSVRFILMTSLYGTLGLSCIVATYCLLRMVGGRSKRNRQYMLLTKRDLDFPLGGGGI